MRTQEPSRTSLADSRRLAGAKPEARSRLTNGKQLFVGVDGRSKQARRWRDVFTDYMARTDRQHEQLCRSLASMVVRREQLDAAIARGDDVDVMDLVRLAGAINRTMARLGLDTAEPVVPADAPPWLVGAREAAP